MGTQHERSVRARVRQIRTEAACQADPKADSDKRLPLPARDDSDYSAKDIEVLEGLEPVRKRPGMYIGGTDEPALHHLAAEILDNSMDEAVAGHASFIEFSMEEGNWLTVRDNGRGIPVDPHPKFKTLSALEVILTTLHSGGKFGGKAYATSGGLHGVGSSVVNALSEVMEVEVARDRVLWKQSYATRQADDEADQRRAGAQPPRHHHPLQARPADFRRAGLGAEPAVPAVPLESLSVPRRGNPLELCARAAEGRQGRRAGRRRCCTSPAACATAWRTTSTARPRCCRRSGRARRRCPARRTGKLEWAVVWLEEGDGFLHSYCNTVPTTAGRHA